MDKNISMEELLEAYKIIYADLDSQIKADRKKKPVDPYKIEHLKADRSNIRFAISSITHYLAPVKPVAYNNKLTREQHKATVMYNAKHNKRKEKILKEVNGK